jgi:hypothetical protein
MSFPVIEMFIILATRERDIKHHLMVKAGNTYRKGRLSTTELLVKVNRFVKKIYIKFSI